MPGSEPAIVFVSEESCPFCAAERWALTVALSHFGTWSQLGITDSSATDVYPNTATLSFRAARYRSAELALSTTELTDNVGRWTASFKDSLSDRSPQVDPAGSAWGHREAKALSARFSCWRSPRPRFLSARQARLRS